MNVGELRRAIQHLSEDTVVVVKVPCSRSEPHDYFGIEREAVEGMGKPTYVEELEEESVVDFLAEQDRPENEDYDWPWNNCIALITK